ncbi:bridging integrator 2b [Tachysurus ichikawai]
MLMLVSDVCDVNVGVCDVGVELCDGDYCDVVVVPQAEEEFSKAQSVFEVMNTELREELPVLYQRSEVKPGLQVFVKPFELTLCLYSNTVTRGWW